MHVLPCVQDKHVGAGRVGRHCQQRSARGSVTRKGGRIGVKVGFTKKKRRLGRPTEAESRAGAAWSGLGAAEACVGPHGSMGEGTVGGYSRAAFLGVALTQTPHKDSLVSAGDTK